MLSNALLGTLEAHLGCSPMLLMADLSDHSPFSHHAPYQSGTGEYGTWDAKRSFEGVTKETMVLHEPVQAIQNTQLAVKHAMTGECGPVALLYHSTALKGRVGPQSVPHMYPTQYYLPATRSVSSAGDIESVARILIEAERPVIIAGNGVRLSKAFAGLQKFAELIGAPVATSASGKGVFPETHALALGVFGTFGLPAANTVVAESDLILAVGTKLSPTDTALENPKLLDPQRQVLVHIDVESNNAGRTFPCEQALVGDAGVVLEQLIEAIQEKGNPSQEALGIGKKRVADARADYGFFNAAEFASDESPALPQRIAAEIHNALPDDAFVTCDAGENRLFMTHYFQTKQPDALISPAAIGGMGYAIPAALSAKLVYPERKILAVCGDGGFSIAMNGLMTACDEGLPIVTLVFNNRSLGWVMHGQRKRLIASELAEKNYANIARAMGCRGINVETPEHLNSALSDAFAAGEPTVLDVATSHKITFKSVKSPLGGSP